MNDLVISVIALIAGGAVASLFKWIDSTIDRRREDKKERDKEADQRRITDADRLDTVQERYDKLRKQKDDQDDAFDKQERELRNVIKLYDGAITAVQWLILDNQLMSRKLGLPPDPRYLHLTNNDIAVSQRDLIVMLEDKQREIDQYERVLRKVVDSTAGMDPND